MPTILTMKRRMDIAKMLEELAATLRDEKETNVTDKDIRVDVGQILATCGVN